MQSIVKTKNSILGTRRTAITTNGATILEGKIVNKENRICSMDEK